MYYLQVLPVLAEVFGDESAMAFFGGRLAAQEAGFVHELLRHDILNFSLGQQLAKLSLVPSPVDFFLFIGVEDFLGRRQFRLVVILNTRDFLQEVLKVQLFSKTGQLRYVIQSDVNDGTYTGFPENSEELTCSFLRKTYCE